MLDDLRAAAVRRTAPAASSLARREAGVEAGYGRGRTSLKRYAVVDVCSHPAPADRKSVV